MVVVASWMRTSVEAAMLDMLGSWMGRHVHCVHLVWSRLNTLGLALLSRAGSKQIWHSHCPLSATSNTRGCVLGSK
jgi:hypothetical protein